MDFKDYLIEEEKKQQKFVVTFLKDTEENEVYTVLAPKVDCDAVVTGHDRWAFIASSEAIKLASKGFSAKLFDLNNLKKHVAKELDDDEKKTEDTKDTEDKK